MIGGIIRFAQANLNSGTTYYLFVGAAPATQEVCVTGFGLYGFYNAAATPGLVQFCRGSSAGSSGSSLAPEPLREAEGSGYTFQSTWKYNPTSPTVSITLGDWGLNPQLAITELWNQNDYIWIKPSGILIVQFTPQQTCNYSGWMRIAE